MLATLLTLALAAPATQPAAMPPKAESPVPDAAAEMLMVALEDDSKDVADAAREAAALFDDRWQAKAKLEAAAEAGDERAIEEIAADLAFDPVGEAELPEGFPTITPVGEIEVKRYPRYSMAVAHEDDVDEQRMFWALFAHIQQNDIPMTAPVEMTMGDDGRDMKAMAFLYPDPTTETTAGTDEGVERRVAEPQTVVSLGRQGRRRAADIEVAAAILRAYAREQGYEVAGDLRVMGYNGPSVPPSRQFFEIQYPVEPIE